MVKEKLEGLVTWASARAVKDTPTTKLKVAFVPRDGRT